MKQYSGDKWFSYWGLFFSILFFSWVGAVVYLIIKGNRITK